MGQPFVVNDSSDEAQITKAEKQMEDRTKDVDTIMSTERGRRWYFDMIFDKCHLLANSYVPQNAGGTAYNEGVRQLGVQMYNTAKESQPALFMKMLEENHFE